MFISFGPASYGAFLTCPQDKRPCRGDDRFAVWNNSPLRVGRLRPGRENPEKKRGERNDERLAVRPGLADHERTRPYHSRKPADFTAAPGNARIVRQSSFRSCQCVKTQRLPPVVA